MTYVFGPVPSRRLGLSLGIDLIPRKTCTYDCLYCQVGKTSCKTIEPAPFVPVREVLEELVKRLETAKPDTITLAGSGEPTLHSEIDQLISLIHEITDIPIALLTNGSLFWNEEIRSRVSGVDIIMPTLSTVSEVKFKTIHRPHSELSLPKIIEGLKKMREEYAGLVFLEVVLLAGINDSEKEIDEIKRVIDEIYPDKIQLNTVVRPPSDPKAIPLDRRLLENIKEKFGKNAEIIASQPLKHEAGYYDSKVSAILEMAKRRPVSASDIASVLNQPLEEVKGILKGLQIKGIIREEKHEGNIFYLAE